MALFKAMSSMNEGLVFRGGSDLLFTSNDSSTIYMQSRLSFRIPGERAYPIFNTDRFIQFLNLFQNPLMDFGPTAIKVTDDLGRSGSFSYTEERYIKGVSRPANIRNTDVSFILSQQDFQQWRKAIKVMGGTLTRITEKGITQDRRGVEDSFTIEMDLKSPSGPFEMVLASDKLDMMHLNSYKVDVDLTFNAARFSYNDDPDTYYILFKETRPT